MRILLADGQPKVRFALRVLLGRQDGYDIVGETETTDGLLDLAEKNRPDLILLGWELPGFCAADSLNALRAVCPNVTVIALSAWPEARRNALIAGADGFVSKADPPEKLLTAIYACECK